MFEFGLWTLDFGNGLGLIRYSKFVIQNSIFSCVQAVANQWLGLWVITNETGPKLLAVCNYLTLRTGILSFYKHLSTLFKGLFASVGVNFITGFHSTYKGNYKVYKLIIVIE